MSWTPVSSVSGNAWVALGGERDNWVDPRLTLILTEAGLNIRTEDDGFLAIETMSSGVLVSVWVPL